MKKLSPLGLVMAILIAALAVGNPSSTSAQSAGLISSLLNRMERNRQDLKSLRANLSMEKYNAQLRDSDRYSGSVLYVPATGRNAYVRVEWQYPQREILAVSNGKYTLFRPRLNMAYEGNARSGRGKVSTMFDFMNMSRQQLVSRFEPLQDIYEETLWGGVRATHIKLVPKGAASYKWAEVWVDGGGMPVQTKIVEKNDDATTVRLTNMARNTGVAFDEFTLKLDSTVIRVRG